MTRKHILDLTHRYFSQQSGSEFKPGDTPVPVSGKCLDADDLSMLVDASLDMWLTAGRFADEFESELAKYFGLAGSRLTNSGSSANLLAVSCLTSPELEGPVGPGDEIITVAAAFPTTVAPIIQNQCIPVFVDIEIETCNVDVRYLEEALSPRTRAVMLAHTLGNPFPVAEVTEFADRHGLFVIEDCCDALGATYGNKLVGCYGDIATLSFYPAHHITTGEGGAVLSNRSELLRIMESYRDFGRHCCCKPGEDNSCGKRFGWELGGLPSGFDHKYTYSHLGYSLKLTDMQAAVGLSQLNKIERFVERRQRNFEFLKAGLENEGMNDYFILPQPTLRSEPSWFGFLLTLREGSLNLRSRIIDYLEQRKIATRLLFGGNLTKQPAFQSVKYRTVGELANTDKAMNDSFWIGVWPGLTEQHLSYVVEVFAKLKSEIL